MNKHKTPAEIAAVRPRVSEQQAADIVALAEAIAEDGQPTPWALVITQWKKNNTVRGGQWVSRAKLAEEENMPYSNVPDELKDSMEKCIQKVMKEDGKDKESAIKICYASVVEKGAAAKSEEQGEMVLPTTPIMPALGATSFADLTAQASLDGIRNLTANLSALAQNILDGDAENKLELLKGLADEFAGLVQKQIDAMTAKQEPEAEEPKTEEPATEEPPAQEPEAAQEPPAEQVEPEEQGARINAKMLAQLKDARDAIDAVLTWGSYSEPEKKPEGEEPPPEEEAESFAESVDGAGIVLLDEVALSEGDGGRRSPLKIDFVGIRPGWGNKRDKHYYPAGTLREYAPVFVGKKMYATNHVAGEKNVMNTEVGVIDELKGFADDGAPIYKATIFHPAFAEIVRNRADAQKLNTLECSILASGKARPGEVEGVKGKIVEAITDAQSIDWVTKAGAGGAALQLSEAEQEPVADTGTEATLTHELIDETHQDTVEMVQLSEAEIESVLAKSVMPTWAQDWLRESSYRNAEELGAAITRAIPRVKKATRSGDVFGQGEGAPLQERSVTPEEFEERKKTNFNRIMRQYGAREV